MGVHHALDEIVPLHSILVRSTIRKMRERQFTQFVLFQLPEILQASCRPGIQRASRNTFR
jgi:hypothetical protein